MFLQLVNMLPAWYKGLFRCDQVEALAMGTLSWIIQVSRALLRGRRRRFGHREGDQVMQLNRGLTRDCWL